MNKLIKSKYFLRRVLIILSLFIVSLVLIKSISFLIDKGNTDASESTQESTDTNSESTENGSPSESTEATTSGAPDTTAETIAETTVETTAETTASTTAETTSKPTTEATVETTAETTVETTTKETINMDFSKVAYYIERLNARYTAYFNENQSLNQEEIVLDVNMNLDYSFYKLIESVDNPNNLLVICNKYYQLPSDFTPKDLQSVPDGYYVKDGKEYRLKGNALDAFKDMSDAAGEAGLSLKIISAYRSNQYQSNLYEKYKNNNGQVAADRFSARPGHSEHETGLAIDINEVAKAFENTDEFAWLGKNAHLYGYVLRYPSGKENLTGYMYEPWHYRYLGVEVATSLKASGLTYDAYYAMYILE